MFAKCAVFLIAALLVEIGVSTFAPVQRSIDRVRLKLTESIDRRFDQREAILVKALLIGERREMTNAMRDSFRRTGVSHITSVSGMHLVIVVAAVRSVLVVLPGGMRFFAEGLSILFFVLLTGAEAATVRAGIMATGETLSRFLGRPKSGMRLLFAAAIAMVLAAPKILIDIGFQLSFSATLGIQLWQKKIEDVCPNFIPRMLRSNIAVSFAAYGATLPFVIYHFRSISIIGPLANIVAVPLIPVIMGGATLSLLFGTVASVPTTLLIRIFFALIDLFSRPTWAMFDL